MPPRSKTLDYCTGLAQKRMEPKNNISKELVGGEQKMQGLGNRR